jgi:membrane protein implicated in regulation of membrane protease activity
VFSFDSWAAIWITVALVAAVVEVSIPHFGIIFVSAGAIAAAAAAYLSFGLPVQIVLFIIVVAISFLVLRPRILKNMGAAGVPGRTEVLIGHEGVVTHDIETTLGAGRVNVEGQDWAARAVEPIAAGTRIRVVGADGIVLEVKPA